MQHDIIVIGGSYAGMAAALQLLRARRSVVVLDAGQRRNRFATHSHGFLGQDGVELVAFAACARQQLEAYPTLTWVDGRASAIAGEHDHFTVNMSDGTSYNGRRILLATGVADQLPEIDGFGERWGKTIFHCPYCHGYELNMGQIGILAGPMSTHQAELLTEWGDITFLANGVIEPDVRDLLEGRGIKVEEAPIDRIEGEADVRLADGRVLSFSGLFAATRVEPSGPLAQASGCRLEQTPMGHQVHTDAAKETSVPGIFACGDIARMPHSVSFAVGDGAMAGVHVHRSLLWPKHGQRPVVSPKLGAAEGYTKRVVGQVPGLRDLHRMSGLLLAERVPTDGRVLVLGAGGGLELRAFAEMSASWRFDGVDPSPEMLAQARGTLGDQVNRVTFLEGTIDDAPEGPFDGATCLLTLHFLPYKQRLQTVRAVHRRLRPGAPFVVAHHSFPTTGEEQDLWLRRNAAFLVSAGIPVSRAEKSIEAIKARLPALSPEEDEALLRAAGFVDLQMFYAAFTFKGWVGYR